MGLSVETVNVDERQLWGCGSTIQIFRHLCHRVQKGRSFTVVTVAGGCFQTAGFLGKMDSQS